eukprot:GHVN01017983.1.p1 GENE.GHVN01017983.1~~GHVN01017983.1.p1  ORF type:complete len:362 (+),score=43.08 GHVN01017983.1:212-1297(+)
MDEMMFVILVSGKTGTGKSTLINQVFGDDVAKTGVGTPVTQKVEEFKWPEKSLTLLDSKGLEAEAYQETLNDLKEVIDKRGKSKNAWDQIAVAWVCVSYEGKRFEDCDKSLVELLIANRIHVVIVVTQTTLDPEDFINDEFINHIRAFQLEQDYGYCAVVPLMAADKAFNKQYTCKAHGLEELVMQTGVMIPTATEAVFAKAHQVKIDELTNSCFGIIHIAAASAAAGAGIPVPFTGAVTSPPIQAKMLNELYSKFGVEMSAKEILSVTGSILGTNAMRSGAIGLLQCIPGVNLVATAVSSTSAFAATEALGHAVLNNLLAERKGADAITSDQALAVLKKTIMSIKANADSAPCESAAAGA